MPAMAFVTSVSEAEAGRDKAQVEMIQRKEQREEGQSQKENSGEKQRAGDHGADRAFHTRARANHVQIADRLHGRGGEHFASCRSEHDSGNHRRSEPRI